METALQQTVKEQGRVRWLLSRRSFRSSHGHCHGFREETELRSEDGSFQVEQMIADVSRARNDLAVLAVDDSVTLERFTQCEVAALNLETVATELLTTAWVPKNSCELTASIVSVHKNIEQVQADIAAALDVVLLECKPDETLSRFHRLELFSASRIST